MTAAPNLPLLAREVSRELRSARQIAKANASGVEDYGRRYQAEMVGLARFLTAKHGARITHERTGTRVRLAGLTAHSTSGLAGALTNWLTQAKEKGNG